MDTFKISATGLSINYLPEYLADHLGFFRDLDLKVETDIPQPWTQVLKDIDTGTHHAVCGGIWVPSIYIQHKVKQYKAFAKISSRCPMMLVSREPIPAFTWKDMEGKVVLVPGDNGVSPFMWLYGCAKEGGADVNKVKFVHDFANYMLAECFIVGEWGDMYFTNAVFASKAVEAGVGTVVCDMTKMGGPVPWSVYYSTPEVLNHPSDLCSRFALGVQRGLDWLRNHKGDDCRDILARNWPQMNIGQMVEVVDGFLRNGMWDESIEIGHNETLHYAKYQVDIGTLDAPLPYDRLVDIRPLNYVQEQMRRI